MRMRSSGNGASGNSGPMQYGLSQSIKSAAAVAPAAMQRHVEPCSCSVRASCGTSRQQLVSAYGFIRRQEGRRGAAAAGRQRASKRGRGEAFSTHRDQLWEETHSHVNEKWQHAVQAVLVGNQQALHEHRGQALILHPAGKLQVREMSGGTSHTWMQRALGPSRQTAGQCVPAHSTCKREPKGGCAPNLHAEAAAVTAAACHGAWISQ